MKLNKQSSFKINLTYFGVMLILTLGSATPSYAATYHFEDDFSDPLLSGWKFVQVDFSSVPTATVNHTFVIQNEELVSTGTLDVFKENAVFVPDNTAFGGWSFDLYLPSSLTLSQDHQIMMSREELGYETFHAIFSLNIERDSLNLRTFNGTDSHDHDGGISTTVTLIEYDKYQHYDLIRTVDRFYVFIDKIMALNMTLTLNLDTSVNYFGLVATQGSNARFDNIQITTDGIGLLNELLGLATSNPSDSSSSSIIESETSSSSLTVDSSNEVSSSDETLFLTIGPGAITLLVGGFFWRKYQQK
ncbi:MAG: hypothetical protein GPJ54_22090 [Candidatus Heimdallarchaeota archaeon]|nr:hypothetical protein [Candidatus Heimdallarchaeota archaeon]